MKSESQERCFALADMCQVLGCFVVTPTMSVTDALYSGNLVDDIACILEELDVPDAPSIVSELKLHMAETVVSEDADTFFHRVRKDYTHLYTNPQFSASTLFQSRFLGYEEGARGLQIALADTVQNLKAFYLKRGFTSTFVPALRVDHMAVELSFLQALHTNEGVALRDGDQAVAQEIAATIEEFMSEYLGKWGVPFFEEMAREAEEEIYRLVGRLGVSFMKL
ncbi:molecular chaperone TorD family protein [Adlercreutzia mucosicola]|uniref:molecular chaperone TorD family protein n=1 Tax=Adlercreutzia mucosicola TaxID=580026 RepID=UPI002B24674B|nr:molecular chaperone TorD family protein [Adlercreutzia mucosicola]MEB1814904.1 molecular chaperone TorD family protein [Adlercreutzia mucosicola]